MSADAWLHRIEERERSSAIGYEYGPEARRLITEYGVRACPSHGGAKAVLDVAEDLTTARSLAELALDMPDKVRAIDHAGRKLVMQAARLRVKTNGTLRLTPPPVRALVPAVASVAQSPREARARRAHRSSRASPDDPDLPRRCEYCGRPLVGRRPQTKTCSDSHRVLLHRRRRRAKAGA
jgi:hypothetical protein